MGAMSEASLDISNRYEVMAKSDSEQQARSCGIFSNPAGDASERAMKSAA